MNKDSEFKKLIYEIKEYPFYSIISKPSYLGIVNYRIFSIFYNVSFLKPFYYILFPIWRVVSLIVGIEIYGKTIIGKGLKITHFGGIFINPKSILGNNIHIYNNVTIGTNTYGDGDCPIIGNGVRIGVGAKILGGIKIGNGVDIGANSVVTKDFPDNCIIAGIPAKIIKYKLNKIK